MKTISANDSLRAGGSLQRVQQRLSGEMDFRDDKTTAQLQILEWGKVQHKANNARMLYLHKIATMGCFELLHRNRKPIEQIAYLAFVSIGLFLRSRVDQ